MQTNIGSVIFSRLPAPPSLFTNLKSRNATKIGFDIKGIEPNAKMGSQVSLNGDGTIIAVSSPYYNDGEDNKGKVREIRDLLPKRIKILSTKKFKIKSPKETGKTFIKNSLIKAKYFSDKTGKVCIADDSGLEIDILNKQPGIYSARWGGKNSDFKKAIKKVFRELEKKDKFWKKKIIRARFVCALSKSLPYFSN